MACAIPGALSPALTAAPGLLDIEPRVRPTGRRGMLARTMASRTPVELAPIAWPISANVCPVSLRRRIS
jgi:hypothetical protein